MSANIDISIVIVNYNVKDFLLQALKSIEAARKSLKLEILVVDNNSVDGSVDYLKPLFPNVNFIPLDDNIGFGRANNLAIDIAKGKYLLILNPDTILSEDTLEIMYDYMENNPNCGISGCKVLNPDGTFQLACRRGFPTPWASFAKLFGLQSLFPNSKLFAQYNQTYKSVDETYPIDAVIGAFMFCKTDLIKKLNGFDPDFFMYGEDIDLCYRVKQSGFAIDYVHSTSIIHFKGESTRRSSINEVRHFYQAMEIFARKHYGKSNFFLLFLKTGIFLRSILAYFLKNKTDFYYIISDILSANFALILSTKIRFQEFFGFPDYAYPNVFIVISAVIFLSLISIGEYFESKQSIRRTIFGLMISFFVLSSFTYFFPEYRFSRGVLLMTIGFTTLFASANRFLVSIIQKIRGKESDKKIAIVGTNEDTVNLINQFKAHPIHNIVLTGIVSSKPINEGSFEGYKILGDFSYIKKILSEYKIKELIISGNDLNQNEIIRAMQECADLKVGFHLVHEFDEYLAAQILNDLSGIEPTIPKFNISIFRNKILKRMLDLIVAFIALTIGLPLLAMKKNSKSLISNFFKILKGKKSLIGYSELEGYKSKIGKPGLISLADINKDFQLSKHAIYNLNDYYLKHFSFSLDLDILIKFMVRK